MRNSPDGDLPRAIVLTTVLLSAAWVACSASSRTVLTEEEGAAAAVAVAVAAAAEKWWPQAADDVRLPQATTTNNAGAATGVVSGMVAGPGTFIGGCEIFPPDNAWNVDVSSPSIAKTTARTLSTSHLHPDLGGFKTSGPYGIPFNVVAYGQPFVSIKFNQFASESDPGPAGWTVAVSANGDTGTTTYPIPSNVKIEGDREGQTPGDDHMLVLQQGSACGDPCSLWRPGRRSAGRRRHGPRPTARCGTWTRTRSVHWGSRPAMPPDSRCSPVCSRSARSRPVS